MKKTLFCASYGIDEIKAQERDDSVSGTAMTKYLVELLNQNEVSVQIVSALKSKKNKFGYIKKYEKELSDINSIIVSPALCIPGKIGKIFKNIYLNGWIFFYLMRHTKRGEKVFIYHNINKLIGYLLAKKVKKLKYCLFVGEIYHNISLHTKFQTKLENKMLYGAENYIFVSEELKKKIVQGEKKSVVISGILSDVPVYKGSFDDNRIHIVYAGIINKNKGAFTLCEVAEFLGDKYHIHILGYGTDEDINLLKDKVNSASGCKISYDGLLSGEEYQRFLQKCHIGVCPQITESSYNVSSFPSKISVYLANNLRVIAPNIKSIKENKLGSCIYYYEEDTPKSIAEAIKKVDINEDYNSRELVSKCHKEAIEEINKLLVED